MSAPRSVPPARPAVLKMKAYVPPLEGRRHLVRLDFNENTVGFPEELPHFDPELLTAYPEYAPLRARLAEHLGVDPEWVMLANGSDEGLFVAAFTFVRPDHDVAVVSSPTFALIPHYLHLCQARVVEVPVLEDLSFDLDALEEALAGARIGMFASPDNPTGGVIPVARLERWLDRFPETLIILDEAYGEYHGKTALPLVERYPNLLVSRTFSKAWGLAGLRLGVVVGHPQAVEWMSTVRSPYSVNSLAVKTLLEFLHHAPRVEEQARETLRVKAWVIDGLRTRGYAVTPGAANFFLVWVGVESRDLCTFLRERGILVRDRSHLPKMGGSVRVSVGSLAQMESFLECLDEFRERRAVVFDLDDTLVDTSRSYDRTVLQLVEELSGTPIASEELQAIRAEGGFNDDWETTAELLRRRGREVDPDEVERRAKALYLSLAPAEEHLLIEPEWLQRLALRHRLFIFTGRPRDEYEPLWQERLGPLFEEVVCKDDRPGVAAKPRPDGLLDLMQRHQLEGATYVGNSVDDMACARAAGCRAVGVPTNQSPEVLEQAGAQHVVERPDEVKRLWMLDRPV